VLNAILALQMVYYWNAPSEKAKGKRKAAPIASSATTTSSTPTRKGPTTRRRG
jgi:mannose-P-dolichol utilization defect protein 1